MNQDTNQNHGNLSNSNMWKQSASTSQINTLDLPLKHPNYKHVTDTMNCNKLMFQFKFQIYMHIHLCVCVCVRTRCIFIYREKCFTQYTYCFEWNHSKLRKSDITRGWYGELVRFVLKLNGSAMNFECLMMTHYD